MRTVEARPTAQSERWWLIFIALIVAFLAAGALHIANESALWSDMAVAPSPEAEDPSGTSEPVFSQADVRRAGATRSDDSIATRDRPLAGAGAASASVRSRYPTSNRHTDATPIVRTPLQDLLIDVRRGGQFTPYGVSAVLDSVHAELILNGRRLSRADARALSELVDLLIRQGSESMDGVRDFLLSGQDVAFDLDSGMPSSLRLIVLEALGRMDTASALRLQLSVLTRTRSPREVAALTEGIEARYPGQYRPLLVESARRALNGGTGDRSDAAGPLFERLAEWGALTADELEQAARHRREYAQVALALLPDGAGIPALLDWVSGPDAGMSNPQGQLALQLLAQVAADDPLAAQGLAGIVREGLVPEQMWATLANLVAGTERIQLSPPPAGAADRRYILRPGGTQVLYRVRDARSPARDEADDRLAVIDRLLHVSQSAAAETALAQARGRLAAQARSDTDWNAQ